MPSYDRALHALRSWLDSWSGIGRVAVGMHRQGFDLQLTQYDERGWRATFYTTGMEHSPTSEETSIGRMTRRERDDQQRRATCERCGHWESDHDNGLLCRVLYCGCRVFGRAPRDKPGSEDK
jgi:hypothetical protein